MKLIKPQRVRRHVARLDTGGKHGKPATVGRVRDEMHVLVRVPITQLDAIDPADVKRVATYAARSTPLPAVLASYGERACARGANELFVWNGNHRVAAAKLRGQETVNALVPLSDYRRWKACRR